MIGNTANLRCEKRGFQRRTSFGLAHIYCLVHHQHGIGKQVSNTCLQRLAKES